MAFNKKRSMYGLLLLIISVIIASVVLLGQSKELSDTPKVVHSLPTEYLDPRPFLGCSQIANDNQYIYLLIDDHEGLIEVYDTTGKYVKSILIYTHTNGAIKIAVNDEQFLIRDMQGSIYIFENGVFVSFLSYMKGVELRKSVDFESTSLTYYQKNGSIWKNAENGPECIIEGSISSQRYFVYWILRVIVLAVLVLAIVLYKVRP